MEDKAAATRGGQWHRAILAGAGRSVGTAHYNRRNWQRAVHAMPRGDRETQTQRGWEGGGRRGNNYYVRSRREYEEDGTYRIRSRADVEWIPGTTGYYN